MQMPIGSPRPAPVFFPEPCFSQRKRTPSKVPPKAPTKSCPPVSRVFHNSRYKNGAHSISFLSNSANEPIISPHYTTDSQQQYFEQCFDIIQKLGEGSFGEVFKVKSKEDGGRLYAIKRSRQCFHGEWDRRKKLDEVEKHEQLPPHPNCVRFYRAWEERLHLYIQTELCLMNLSVYCDMYGKLPERKIWRVLFDIAKAVKHLHDNRLCHLDIKPANIFLSQDGFNCKLGDFGLVVSMDSDFKEALEGDACYVAPELLQGKFGPAADVFSLGISLLELACDLEVPSHGPTWHALRQGHLPQKFIKDLSSSLVSILSWMMTPYYLQRPTIDNILSHRSLRTMYLVEPIIRVKNKIIPAVSKTILWLYGLIVHLILLILGLFRSSTMQGSHDNVTPPVISKPEDHLSDSDDNELILSIHNSTYGTHNGSWINNSPVSTHCPLYTGSPIPLQLEESSADEATPLRPGSPLLTSSPTTSMVRLTRSEGQITRSRRAHTDLSNKHSKIFNGGPRNLLEIFNDAA